MGHIFRFLHMSNNFVVHIGQYRCHSEENHPLMSVDFCSSEASPQLRDFRTGSSRTIQGSEERVSTLCFPAVALCFPVSSPQFPPPLAVSTPASDSSGQEDQSFPLEPFARQRGWDEPSEENHKAWMLSSVVPFFLRSDILQLLAILYRFPLPSNSWVFLHFYLVLVQTSYSLSLSEVSA